jgi:hypothetical protein
MAEDPVDLPDEALVGYVRGRLPEAEAARIASLAAESPQAAAEIALARGLAADVDAEAARQGPGALGWARIAQALDRAEAPARRPRWPVWQMAAAAAAAVVVWQVAAVPLLPGPEPGYSPVSEGPAAGPRLTVAFAPAATEAEVRALLRAVGGEVVGGPSAIGLWQIGFADAAARDSALARMARDPVVESAQAD